ncbi:hypothetical protein K2Y00_03985 [Patescibacteria group bacterium]|nr:hypothetical protein [Patescibacteria group bacterium]
MSEIVAESREGKRVNVSELFRHSYIFSQGSPPLQLFIANWLARTACKGMKITLEEVMPQKITAYARGEMERGGHTVNDQVEEDAMINAKRFVAAFESGGNTFHLLGQKGDTRVEQEYTDAQLVENIVYDLITQEHTFLSSGGRPTTSRDPYSSFIIDYGLLKRGTGPWPYSAVPEAYKEMWDEIIERIQGPLNIPKDYQYLLAIINIYLQKHPSLSEDMLEKVLQFKQHILESAQDRVREMEDEGDKDAEELRGVIAEGSPMPLR